MVISKETLFLEMCIYVYNVGLFVGLYIRPKMDVSLMSD